MSHVCHGLYKIKYFDIHVTCMYVNVDLSIIVIVNIDALNKWMCLTCCYVMTPLVLFCLMCYRNIYVLIEKHIVFIRLQVCITIISPYALENDECVVKFSKQNCRLIINNVYFHLEVLSDWPQYLKELTQTAYFYIRYLPVHTYNEKSVKHL